MLTIAYKLGSSEYKEWGERSRVHSKCTVLENSQKTFATFLSLLDFDLRKSEVKKAISQ